MNPWARLGAFVSTGVLVLSGSTYFVAKNWFQPEDPFSVVSHPLEPLALKTHILVGPLLVFAFGLLFQAHFLRKLELNSSRGRAGGIVTGVLFGFVVLSGYLLQTVGTPQLHDMLVYFHLGSGLCFSVLFAYHSLYSRRQRRRIRDETDTERIAA